MGRIVPEISNPKIRELIVKKYRIVYHVLEQEIEPPKGVQMIRRYGLYSSRIKGAWDDLPYVAERAPVGWKEEHVKSEVSDAPIDFDPFLEDESVDSQTYKQAWVRLLAKVQEIDPFVCPKCGSKMKVIAVIQKPEEVRRILRHVVKLGYRHLGWILPPGTDFCFLTCLSAGGVYSFPGAFRPFWAAGLYFSRFSP